MSTFKPLLPPHKVGTNGGTPIRLPIKPPSISAAVRDQMAISSWLLMGAALQGLTMRFFGYYTLLPSALLILFRTANHALMPRLNLKPLYGWCSAHKGFRTVS
jgi:hypothetical protein